MRRTQLEGKGRVLDLNQIHPEARRTVAILRMVELRIMLRKTLEKVVQ
jgi:hypothetical protein